MNDLNFRFATPNDAPILARHRTEMWLAMGDLLPEETQTMFDFSEAYFRETVASEEYIGWLAEAEGKVVAGGGLVIRKIAPAPNKDKKSVATILSGHVFNVFVEPEYRGQGLAKIIMQKIETWAKENSLKALTLNASAQGKPIYESLGYEMTYTTNAMKLTL